MRVSHFLIVMVLSLLGCANLNLQAKPLDETKIKEIMQAFNVPGAAIGIVHKGKVVAAKGYGVKTLGKNERIDGNSIFKIASNTKAFTAGALAILVDEGKISWEGKVQNYLPSFKLYDPWVSEQFNLIDLLTHRSGLGLGAGDLMLWPEPSSFTRQEVLHNLRYLKPTGEFRADYAYDNLLYIVAGEVVPAVTGQSWEEFVEQRIMQPLGMRHCFAGNVSEQMQAQLATPHGMVDGKLQTIIRPVDKNKSSVSGPAGGIQCSLNDMLKWVKVQLAEGAISDKQRLFSQKQHKMMWQPQTIMPLYASSKRRDNSHFSAYALGWRVNDMDGTLQVHHTGSLAGMYSFVSLFPELDLGFVVLTNQQSSAARSSLMYTVMKPYLGDNKTDWLAEFTPPNKTTRSKSNRDTHNKTYLKASISETSNTEFIGAYDDLWLGRFIIDVVRGHLQVRSERVTKFVGDLYQYGPDQLLIRWHDRSLEADAIISFKRDGNDKINGMTIRPQSNKIDFSYDFQDLDFTKVRLPKD